MKKAIFMFTLAAALADANHQLTNQPLLRLHRRHHPLNQLLLQWGIQCQKLRAS